MAKSKVWGVFKTGMSIAAGAVLGGLAVRGFDKLMASYRDKDGEKEPRALPPPMPSGPQPMPMPIPFVQPPMHAMPPMMPLVSFGTPMPMMPAMPAMPAMPPVFSNPWPSAPTRAPAHQARDEEEAEEDEHPAVKAYRDLEDDDE